MDEKEILNDEISNEEISFEDLGLDEATLQAVEAKGFENPTPIQILAIPRLLDGDANIIAKARTGTGKTAAFGLPLVQKIRSDCGYPQALILTPTRELCMQVCREIESFATGKFPRLTAVYGGASMGTQLKDLKKGVEIVVGTPGRVKDHIERGTLKLDKISYFILDEADEMLDMGFREDIENIFQNANPDSRILLFSATMPKEILQIAANFMGEYEVVEEETKPEEPLLTEQHYWVVREYEKIEALVRLIDLSPDFYGLVFTQTKSDADSVSKQLDERGYEVAALHGDIPQAQREKILARFRSKKTRILVATDVAARGIDIEGLTHVVNYAIPYDGPTYVHRIGRTGRAGAKGLAFTLVRPEERRRVEYLKQVAKKSTKGDLIEDKIPSVDEVLAVKKERIFADFKAKIGIKEEKPLFPETVEEEVNSLLEDGTEVDNQVENQPAPKPEEVELPKIRKEYASLAEELCKADTPENMVARVLQIYFGRQLDPARYGSITPLKTFNQGKQIRIYVQLGRRDGFNPREIASYFSSLLHIAGRMVDRIEVADTFSLVSLPYNAGKELLERAKKDRSLPHMHVDSKSGDSFEKENRGGRGGKGRDRGGRDRNGRDRNSRFDRGDRSERGSRETKGRGGKEGRNSKSSIPQDRRRKDGLPGFERRADEKTSNASLYKKKRF